MTSLLLGEQVVHGLDIARAAKVRWDIDPRDALMIVPGVLTVAPRVPSTVRGHRAGELRTANSGANHYRMAVDHGTAVVTAAGEKSDCVITADPVAFCCSATDASRSGRRSCGASCAPAVEGHGWQ